MLNKLFGKSETTYNCTKSYPEPNFFTLGSLWSFLFTHTELHQDAEVFISEDSFHRLKIDLSSMNQLYTETLSCKRFTLYNINYDTGMKYKKIIKPRKSLKDLQIIVRKLK